MHQIILYLSLREPATSSEIQQDLLVVQSTHHKILNYSSMESATLLVTQHYSPLVLSIQEVIVH